MSARPDTSASPAWEAASVKKVQRVRKAYEQVYDQLRELIINGEVATGERLPNEMALAREFGVSRGTVREALRALTAENLVRSAKGTGGGTFVTMPTPTHISEFLESSIGILTESRAVSLQEFLELRELLEVFAARCAAKRRTEEDLEAMRAHLLGDPARLTIEQQFNANKAFHSAVVAAAHNSLLSIAAEPIFSVLQLNLRRAQFDEDLPEHVACAHEEILEAVEQRDGDRAAKAMTDHMTHLNEMYLRVGIWLPDGADNPRWRAPTPQQPRGAESGPPSETGTPPARAAAPPAA